MNANYVYTKRPCQHCGMEVGINKLPRHEQTCPGNPEVSVALLQFVKDRCPYGHIMSVEAYESSPYRGGLPSPHAIRLYFGSWRAFADWCGMNLKPQERRKYNDYIPGLDDPDVPLVAKMRREQDEERRIMEGLPVVKTRREVRAWDVKSHRYVPVGYRETYLIR